MNSLKNSRILITGGAGFVGSFVADYLLREDVREIIVLDNLVRGSKNNIKDIMQAKEVKFIKGDIRDFNLLDKITRDVDYCIHMAALRITQCNEEPDDAFQVMFNGTYNVAKACVKNKVKKVLLPSSASVYGQADSFPTKENHHPYNNVTFYGAAKMANELMMRSLYYLYSLNYIIFRCFNIYGPRMDTHGKYTEVLIRWYCAIKEGKRPLIYGDGKQTMDFIYVEDVARANILALKKDVTDKVFNIASGEETSLEELCRLLLEVMESDLKPKHISLPKERKNVEVKRRLADISKTRKELGFEVKTPLKDGLKKLCTWLDENTS